MRKSHGHNGAASALSDEIMCNALINSYACAALISEKVEETIIVPPEKRGKVYR